MCKGILIVIMLNYKYSMWHTVYPNEENTCLLSSVYCDVMSLTREFSMITSIKGFLSHFKSNRYHMHIFRILYAAYSMRHTSYKLYDITYIIQTIYHILWPILYATVKIHHMSNWLKNRCIISIPEKFFMIFSFVI